MLTETRKRLVTEQLEKVLTERREKELTLPGKNCLTFTRVLGRGEPSGARALAAYGPHLSRGSELVHDKENSHRTLVRGQDLVSEAHNSREIKRLPDRENPLWKVNGLCLLLRLFLDGHTGCDRSNFASSQ